MSSKTNVIDEIFTIQSKDLVAEVVSRLNLDYSYYKSGAFHDLLLYGSNLPIIVSLPDISAEDKLSLNVEVTPEGIVKVSKIKAFDEEFDATVEGLMNDSIESPIGTIIVRPNPNFYVEDDNTLQSKYKQDEKESKGNTSIKLVKQSVSDAIAVFTRRLDVKQKDKQGNVINLTITDQSPQRADEILSSIIGVYNESWIRDKNQMAVSTSNFINERLGVIESELGDVDSDISSFKSEHLVPDVDAASSLYMSESQKTAAAIVELNNQLSMMRYIRSYLTAENSLDQLLPANSGDTNATLSTQIGEYNKMVLQRNDLIKKSSERNALVQSLAEQLKAQRNAIIQTVDNQIIEIQTQIKGLQRSEAQTISRISTSPTQAKYLTSVGRQQKVKESLYLFLLQKREDNELSQAFTAYNTRIITRPGPSVANMFGFCA